MAPLPRHASPTFTGEANIAISEFFLQAGFALEGI